LLVEVAVTLGFMSASPSLSLAEWTVLALISEAPTHGFAIYRLTAPEGDLGRIWHIHRPVIYRSIGRLEQAGLNAPQTVEAGRGPQRMIYAATPEGHKATATWLDTPVEHIRDVRSHLLIKLALLDRAGPTPLSCSGVRRRSCSRSLRRSPRSSPSGRGSTPLCSPGAGLRPQRR